ncbi:MAG: CopG family antitoxin [Thermomicrobiales bacterium]
MNRPNGRKQEPPTASRIPVFSSIQEEAEFWDTHDSAEFDDEFEPVDLVVESVSTPRGLAIRLDGAGLAGVERAAQARGVDPAAVAREWIEERARREAEPDPRLAG